MASKVDLFKGKNLEEEDKRRTSVQYLDLSDALVFTQKDLSKLLEKIPDLKLRPDVNLLKRTQAVSCDDLSPHHLQPKPLRSSSRCNSVLSLSGSRPSSSAIPARSFYEFKASHGYSVSPGAPPLEEPYPFESPIHRSMRHLNISDFVGTDIDWRMLTLSRPPTKLEEEYYSRLVKLNQLHHSTRLEDGYGFRKAAFALTRHPRVLQYYKSGVTYLRDSFGISCEDMLSLGISVDNDVDYESYARSAPLDSEETGETSQENINVRVAQLMREDPDEARGPETRQELGQKQSPEATPQSGEDRGGNRGSNKAKKSGDKKLFGLKKVSENLGLPLLKVTQSEWDENEDEIEGETKDEDEAKDAENAGVKDKRDEGKGSNFKSTYSKGPKKGHKSSARRQLVNRRSAKKETNSCQQSSGGGGGGEGGAEWQPGAGVGPEKVSKYQQVAHELDASERTNKVGDGDEPRSICKQLATEEKPPSPPPPPLNTTPLPPPLPSPEMSRSLSKTRPKLTRRPAKVFDKSLRMSVPMKTILLNLETEEARGGGWGGGGGGGMGRGSGRGGTFESNRPPNIVITSSDDSKTTGNVKRRGLHYK